MWELLKTGRWISFTLTAVAAIVAFGFLSHWQWERAKEEEAAAAVVASGQSQAAVPLTDVVSPGTDLALADEWRVVTVSGTMRCDQGFLVRNRPLEATNGLWAACPLVIESGATVWVNRGWLPAPGPAAVVIDMPEQPAGAVEVTGRLRLSETGPDRPPSDLPAGQVSHLDTDVLSAVAGIPGPAFIPYLEATQIVPADPGSLRTPPLPPADSAQNYSYAGQWLLFAAIAIGGWFYFLRREAHDVAAEATAATDQERDQTLLG